MKSDYVLLIWVIAAIDYTAVTGDATSTNTTKTPNVTTIASITTTSSTSTATSISCDVRFGPPSEQCTFAACRPKPAHCRRVHSYRMTPAGMCCLDYCSIKCKETSPWTTTSTTTRPFVYRKPRATKPTTTTITTTTTATTTTTSTTTTITTTTTSTIITTTSTTITITATTTTTAITTDVISIKNSKLRKSRGDFIQDVHPLFWVIVAGFVLILLTVVLIVVLTWHYINSGVWCCGGACINKYLAGPPTKDDILKAKQSKCVKAVAPLVLEDEGDVEAEVEGLRDDTNNKLLDKLYEPPPPSTTLAAAIQKVMNEANIDKFSKYELKKALCRSLQWAEKTKRKVEGMTDELAASIHLYTQETVLYRNINSFLRRREMVKLDPYFLYMAMLLEAVQLLDMHDVCVYRGIKKDLNKDYVVGETVMWWAFSSTTDDPEVLTKNELFLGKKGRRTMFTIVAKCVDIQQYSVYAGEREFLLLPPSRFEVVSKNKDKTGLWTIKLAHHDDQRRFFHRIRGNTASSAQLSPAAHI